MYCNKAIKDRTTLTINFFEVGGQPTLPFLDLPLPFLAVPLPSLALPLPFLAPPLPSGQRLAPLRAVLQFNDCTQKLCLHEKDRDHDLCKVGGV